MSRAEFRDRWIHHAEVGAITGARLMTTTSGIRYCLAVDPSGILDAATNEHDGVALLALRSVVSIPAFHDLLVHNEIAYADELRVFERPVEDVTMFTASELLVDGPETDVVVLDLARWGPDVAPQDHLKALDERRDRDLEVLGLTELGLRRWVRNVLVAPAPRGFRYDVVNELWFESLDHVAAAAGALGELFDVFAASTERRTSKVLVTTVVHRIGRDRP
jgi:hypothetical protein